MPRPDLSIQVSLIAAVARNGVIGAQGELSWREAGDQRHFRERTMGSAVLMGRKTWDSLPARFRPLPGRRNLVLTTDSAWQAPGAEPFRSLDGALQALARDGRDKLFVIGGGQIYALCLPLADELVITEIDADLPGDTFFPTWNRADFDLAGCSERMVTGAGIGYRFVTYRRRADPPRQEPVAGAA